MRKLEMVLETCERCPYLRKHMYAGGPHCHRRKHPIYYPDQPPPQWCPLPEADE